MKRRPFLMMAVMAVLAWACFSPAVVFGQGTTWAGESLAQMVESARWKMGTLRINAALQVINAGYDSDIYYGYLAEPTPDFTLSASAPVQFLLPVSKKVVLDVFDSPQYIFYLDTKRERSWNNSFRGRVHVALDRLYLQAGGGLENIRRRLSPELNINIRQKANTLGGLALWQASREVSLALLYGGARYSYGDSESGGLSIADTLDRKENYFDIVAYFQPNPRIRFNLDGQYGTYFFRVEASRNTRSYGVLGGVDFIPRTSEGRPTRGVGGSVRLGYMVFDIIDPVLVDASSLVGEAMIFAELIRLTTARTFFSRSFQFSIYSGSTYYLSTRYGGGITRRLSRRFYVSYDISFIRSSYPQGDPNAGIPGTAFHRYIAHEFSLGIRLARNLEITLLGSLGKRTLSSAGLSRNRNFFGINLVYGAQMGNIVAPIGGLSR